MSFTPAQKITSSQEGIHHNLETVVLKHFKHDSRTPIAAHNQQAFEQAYQWWKVQGSPKVILDSACGTGESSRHLATTYPDHAVIGLDQSEKRLSHSDNHDIPNNCLLLRCECMDFWRLAHQANWMFELHTLFYPNPYPKPRHLQRRWHGEAAFKNLLAISRVIELRTNWQTYAEEFCIALNLAFQHQLNLNQYNVAEYVTEKTITAFERKYQASEHKLWQVQAKSIET